MISLIYGSGFGLYGYLPAIYKFSKKIYLNKKYQKIFNSRKELITYERKIVWYENITKIIPKVDYLVIAKRPIDQSKIIKKIFKHKNKIKHVFLEKPISLNPKKSLHTLKIFNKRKINYSIGFLFEYVSWFVFIKKKIRNIKKTNIIIKWNIKYNTNKAISWKYNHKEGGGLIRYYGIHFIKLFADLKFVLIKKNIINKNSWKILIEDKKHNTINLILKYSRINNFSYKIDSLARNNFKSPFLDEINSRFIDPRCFFLKKYIRKNLFKYSNNFINLKNFLNLWSKIESKKINVK
jgi:hypothetical protein